jgi:hypothetical protein
MDADPSGATFGGIDLLMIITSRSSKLVQQKPEGFEAEENSYCTGEVVHSLKPLIAIPVFTTLPGARNGYGRGSRKDKGPLPSGLRSETGT